jgi:hypothetical protein
VPARAGSKESDNKWLNNKWLKGYVSSGISFSGPIRLDYTSPERYCMTEAAFAIEKQDDSVPS